jgi:hypothetical protein
MLAPAAGTGNPCDPGGSARRGGRAALAEALRARRA